MARKAIRPIRIEGNVAYVPLTKGYEAVIDASSVPLVEGRNWVASVDRQSVYAVANRPGRGNGVDRLHRVITRCPEGMHVDHVDMDGLNNRLENLRIATNTQNQWNRTKSRFNTSGYKGVSWAKREQKWSAQISVNGKNRSLGYFQNPEDAHAAYCNACASLRGDFGRTA